MSKPRLSAEKWITAGLDVLTTAGPKALAAEPMARRLGATKGSFYWHFTDLAAYHDAVLDRWQQEARGVLETTANGCPAPEARLRELCQQMLSDPSERALRAWSSENPSAAQALKEIDAERHAFVMDMLRELGLGNPGFGNALLASVAGLPTLPGLTEAERLAALETLIDTVLALRD
jgi:AcrR family transcriptional regulator